MGGDWLRPHILEGFPGPRGRPDLKHAPQEIPARLPSGTQKNQPWRPHLGPFCVVLYDECLDLLYGKGFDTGNPQVAAGSLSFCGF